MRLQVSFEILIRFHGVLDRNLSFSSHLILLYSNNKQSKLLNSSVFRNWNLILTVTVKKNKNFMLGI